MAHEAHEMLSKRWGIKPVKCSNACEYFKFPHLKNACVLSDVFSVEQGELCYSYKAKQQKEEETI
jgi:hypothetical protein